MSVVKIINQSGGTSSSGGGGGASLTIENRSAQITGSNTNFSTSSEFVSGSTMVYYNGVLQIRNEDYTEDADREGVTFALAPETSTKVVIIYSASA